MYWRCSLLNLYVYSVWLCVITYCHRSDVRQNICFCCERKNLFLVVNRHNCISESDTAHQANCSCICWLIGFTQTDYRGHALGTASPRVACTVYMWTHEKWLANRWNQFMRNKKHMHGSFGMTLNACRQHDRASWLISCIENVEENDWFVANAGVDTFQSVILILEQKLSNKSGRQQE